MKQFDFSINNECLFYEFSEKKFDDFLRKYCRTTCLENKLQFI